MGTLMSAPTPSLSNRSSAKRWFGILAFFVVAAIGLYWSKWNPYYHKAFVAAAKHSIGASLISGHQAVAESPSWQAAWGYSVTYFKDIYKALIVGVVIGSLVQVLVPRNWMTRLLGSNRFSSTTIGGLAALPGMMCTCCSTPVVVGMRRSSSSVGAATAFWLGSTALNPAVLVFMTFVLSWKFTVLRIVLGIILTFGISHAANRLAGQNSEMASVIFKHAEAYQDAEKNTGSFIMRWIKAMAKIVLGILPPYIVSVLLLGAFRAWLFPTIPAVWANSMVVMVLFAIAGMLFVIPTAGEIPVVQVLQSFGLGAGPAATLMFSLPVISLPSMLMVRQVLPTRVLVFLASSVVVLSLVGGVAAGLLF